MTDETHRLSANGLPIRVGSVVLTPGGQYAQVEAVVENVVVYRPFTPRRPDRPVAAEPCHENLTLVLNPDDNLTAGELAALCAELPSMKRSLTRTTPIPRRRRRARRPGT